MINSHQNALNDDFNRKPDHRQQGCISAAGDLTNLPAGKDQNPDISCILSLISRSTGLFSAGNGFPIEIIDLRTNGQ
tara:strand:- start:4841 stop:5071 length:231 start_codon:yes stop_codon:yes gene_type:complete